MDFSFDELTSVSVFLNLLALLIAVLWGYTSYYRIPVKYILNKKACKTSGTILYAILIAIIAVTYVIGGDFFHYQEAVLTYGYSMSDYMEPIYYELMGFVDRNYLLFRIIVWGCALLLMVGSLKTVQEPIALGLFFLVTCYISIFSYARASLAMTCCTFGLCYLLKNRDSFWRMILGFAVIIGASFFHKSILVLIVCCSFSLFDLSKKKAMLILFSAPVFLFAANYIIESILGGSSSLLGSDKSDIVSYYYDKETDEKNWKGMLNVGLEYASLYWPCYVIFKRNLFIVTSWVSKVHKRLTQVLFLQIIVATSFAFVGSSSSVFFYRFLYMTFPLIVVELTYLWNNRLISKITANSIILLALFSQLWKYLAVIVHL